MKLHFYIFNNGLVSEVGMSGSDQRVYQWSRIFKKWGHRVTLLIPRVGWNRFKDFGFDLIVTTNINTLKFGYLTAYLWQSLRGCMKAIEIGEISSNSVIYSSSDLIVDSLPATLLKVKNRQAKLICGLHLLAPNPFKGFTKVGRRGLVFPRPQNVYYFLSQGLVVWLLKHLADLVLVSNHLDREFLLRKGFKADQVLVTYGGVDFKLIPQKELPIKFDAVWVGRLHSQKGVADLFSAWKEVVARFPKVKLAVVGEDDLQDYFRKQRYYLTLKDKVFFTGYLAGKDLFRLLKSGKIFLCPSYYESFGMVIAEAMAASLPVVAYDLPVYRRIYTQGMVRIPLGDTARFAEAAIRLLSHPKERERLAAEAVRLAIQFNWQKTAEKILQVVGEKDE